MRDIRGDLQERASLVEQQINAAQNQFEKLLEQRFSSSKILVLARASL